MNILQSVTSHKSSRPRDTFQAMSQILEYFKLIEIIMFEKMLRYVRPNLYGTTYIFFHSRWCPKGVPCLRKPLSHEFNK